MKVLIIEDEKDLLNSMQEYLSHTGMTCDLAPDLETALKKIHSTVYDCLIIDIGLPDGNGLKVIEEMKNLPHDTAMLIVSAKDSLDDRLLGLNFGADDYIVKPFHMPELVARIKSVYRRHSEPERKEIVFGELRIVPEELLFYVKDTQVPLTKTEHDLLMFFVNNANRILSRESIAEHLWGSHSDMADSLDFIYSHIKNLRKKIIDQGGKDYIKSIYGVGYKFVGE